MSKHIDKPIWHDGHEAYDDSCFCCRGMEIARLRARVAELETPKPEPKLNDKQHAHKPKRRKK